MRFALMLEAQQGLSYGDHVAIAKRAEANGIETLFRSDHYQSFPGPTGRPTTDAWTVMAGLARETDRIGLGVLVSPVTFRHPGSFAKVVTTVDEMSGGRIEVGVGAGWNELEHRQLGLPFPAIERAGRPHGGRPRDPPRAVGRAGRLGLRGPPGLDPRRAVPSQAGRRPRPAADPDRRRAAATAGRRLRLAALVPDRGPLRRRVQPELVGPGSSPRGVRRRRRGLRRHRARPIDADPLDDGRRAHRPQRGRDARPPVGGGARRSGPTSRIGRGSKSASSAGSPARPTTRARPVRRFDAAGVERIMLQDFLPWDLDMIDVMGEVLVGV